MTTSSGRIEKADVLAYVERGKAAGGADGAAARLAAASPKARRLAAERGLDIESLPGSGPAGAVLAADVLAASPPRSPRRRAGEGAGRRPRTTAWARSGASWPSA